MCGVSHKELAALLVIMAIVVVGGRYPQLHLLGGFEECYGVWSQWARDEKAKGDLAMVVRAYHGFEEGNRVLRQAAPWLPPPPKTRCPIPMPNSQSYRLFHWPAWWAPYGSYTNKE